ncbi:hypothetical protein [Amycolatopsis taiwanensis]|uniref:hypothetical protein n=1 Tax=Amycolatopsis taiwanensis TaxID=342230 RepID=UPI002556ABF9|nr:hypothetical protein [Amycolatopsis taiwanensis]
MGVNLYGDSYDYCMSLALWFPGLFADASTSPAIAHAPLTHHGVSRRRWRRIDAY